MSATRVADASAARAIGPAYAAFISYSRDADGLLAPRLEYALERFATPWYRLRAFRVFRDDASLSSNPGLWSSLTAALDGVGHFILLASPGAAQSPWVGREVEYWLRQREPERMLIVLTDGEIGWDEATGDFDWERTTALPRTISGAFTEEPRYTDLRFAGHSDHITVRDPRFRAAVADIAAPLHGMAKDDLIGEEVRQHRRTMRIARGAGAMLAVFAAAASVAAFLAIREAGHANREAARATREADRAKRQASLAGSRQRAAESAVALQDGNLDRALTQAVGAWREARTTEARTALLAALTRAGGVEGIAHGPRPSYVGFSGDRRKVAVVGPSDDAGPDDTKLTASVIDLATGKPIGAALAIPKPIDALGVALDAHGDRMAVGYGSGSVALWDLATRRMRRIGGGAHAAPHPAIPAFAADGSRLAWGGPGRQILVWDGRRVQRLRSPEPVGDVGWDVALSADGRYLAAAGSATGKLVLWRLGSGRPPLVLPGGAPRFASVTVGDHGPIALGGGRRPVLAVGGADDGRVQLRDAAGGRLITAVRLHRGAIDSLTFSPHGRLLTVVDSRAVTLLRRTGERIAAVPPVGAEYGATPLDEEGRLATIATDGTIVVRMPATPTSAVVRPLHGANDSTAVAFDLPGRTIAAQDRQGRLRLYDPADGRPVGRPVTGQIDLSSLAFLADGRIATCCGLDGYDRVRVWSRDGAGVTGPQPARGPGETIAMAATADGRLVTGHSDGRYFAVVGTGRPLRMRTGDYEGALSPDGGWAVIPGDGGNALWELDRRRRVATVADAALVFSPRGPLVAVGDGPVALVDRFTGRTRATLGSDGSNVEAMAFSPDGRTLAALDIVSGSGGSTRASLVLWDVGTGRAIGGAPLLTLNRFISFPQLTYSPDGRRLALTTDDGEPLVIDLDVDAWAERACELAPSCR